MLGLSFLHAELVVAHITSALVAGLAVLTRIYAKLSTQQGLKLDDVFILLTLLVYYAAVVTVLRGTSLSAVQQPGATY
jgi:uncharacterized membrane protein